MSIDNFTYFGGFKKERHPMDIAEEEAIINKMIFEAAQQQNAQQSATAAGPGAGGVPSYKFFNPATTTAFTASLLTAPGPMTVTFTNLSSPDLNGNASFVLTFGDGWTSSDPNATYLYTNTGSYSASLVSTTFYGGVSTTATGMIISSSKPTVIAGMTYVTASGPAPITATFTNSSSNNSQTPSTTYLVIFGDTTSASYTATTFPTALSHVYSNTGSFTASIQATGSYSIASVYTQSFYAPAPTLTAAFTFTTSSNTSGSVATFVNTINSASCTVYNGNVGTGSLTYWWDLGSGSITSTSRIPTAQVYTKIGPYTASLAVTESLYNITSYTTRSFRLI